MQEVKQRGQEACRDEQGAPGKIQTQKGNIKEVEAGSVDLGQGLGGEYRDAVQACRDRVRKVKAHQELSLASDLKGIKEASITVSAAKGRLGKIRVFC